ncbi:MAG TPA: hypothetical protein DIT64_04645 [Verrucomicrobiales bacterium]|nr:hypothetical protein [Verrucomicrobiales bacterium]
MIIILVVFAFKRVVLAAVFILLKARSIWLTMNLIPFAFKRIPLAAVLIPLVAVLIPLQAGMMLSAVVLRGLPKIQSMGRRHPAYANRRNACSPCKCGFSGVPFFHFGTAKPVWRHFLAPMISKSIRGVVRRVGKRLGFPR